MKVENNDIKGIYREKKNAINAYNDSPLGYRFMGANFAD